MRDILRTDPNFLFHLKEKSFCHDDDDVLLEREITPARNFQVSTEAVGVILVSTAKTEVYTALSLGYARTFGRVTSFPGGGHGLITSMRDGD